MTTITAGPAAATLTAVAPTVIQPTPVMPTAPGQTTEYVVYACTKFGSSARRTIITTAEVIGVTEPAVNAPLQASFVVPWDDPDLDELELATVPYVADSGRNHEVQIFRNGHLEFWGPCVARNGDSVNRQWTYLAQDPLWYFKARFFGEANRHNYLTNGSFEDDPPGTASPSGWNTAGGSGFSEVVDGQFLLGQQSLHMVGSSFDLFVGQIIPIAAGPQGLAVIATAWVFEAISSPAFINSAGLVLKQVQPLTGTIIQQATAPIGQFATPSNRWVRVNCAILLPPNQTSLVEVDLVAAGDELYFDAVTLTTEESLSLIPLNSPGFNGWDQVEVAKMVARYASGTLPIGNPYTKSDLNVKTAGAASGIKMSRTYQFFDHQQVYQGGGGAGALDEFATSADGFDFRCIVTPNSRTLTFYYPGVGRTWDEGLFVYRRVVDAGTGAISGESLRIARCDLAETIEGCADNVTELGGWGDGAGREEGGAFTDTFGDLTLELVEAAPTGADLNLLNLIAGARAAQLGEVQATHILTLVESTEPDGTISVPLIGAMHAGDLVPIVVDDGPIQIAETVRIVSVKHDAIAETLVVGIQLNTPAFDTGHAVPRKAPSQGDLYQFLHRRIYELERRILHVQFTPGED